MAKFLCVIYLILWISFPLAVVGQETSASSDSIQAVGHASPDTTATDRIRNAVYLELLGAGGLYSINYDRHIAGAWGVRAGYSQVGAWMALRDGTIRTMPVHFVYTPSASRSGLELGAGAMFYWDDSDSFLGWQVSDEFRVSASFNVGYRYQPAEGGFLFRIGFTPFVGYNDGLRAGPFGGVSFGYAF